MLLTVTSCHAGSPAGLSLLLQIWVELRLDRDVFKVRKNNTSEKAALSPRQQLRGDTRGAEHAALQRTWLQCFQDLTLYPGPWWAQGDSITGYKPGIPSQRF